jgi:hypothetical protein
MVTLLNLELCFNRDVTPSLSRAAGYPFGRQCQCPKKVIATMAPAMVWPLADLANSSTVDTQWELVHWY